MAKKQYNRSSSSSNRRSNGNGNRSSHSAKTANSSKVDTKAKAGEQNKTEQPEEVVEEKAQGLQANADIGGFILTTLGAIARFFMFFLRPVGRFMKKHSVPFLKVFVSRRDRNWWLILSAGSMLGLQIYLTLSSQAYPAIPPLFYWISQGLFALTLMFAAGDKELNLFQKFIFLVITLVFLFAPNIWQFRPQTIEMINGVEANQAYGVEFVLENEAAFVHRGYDYYVDPNVTQEQQVATSVAGFVQSINPFYLMFLFILLNDLFETWQAYIGKQTSKKGKEEKLKEKQEPVATQAVVEEKKPEKPAWYEGISVYFKGALPKDVKVFRGMLAKEGVSGKDYDEFIVWLMAQPEPKNDNQKFGAPIHAVRAYQDYLKAESAKETDTEAGIEAVDYIVAVLLHVFDGKISISEDNLQGLIQDYISSVPLPEQLDQGMLNEYITNNIPGILTVLSAYEDGADLFDDLLDDDSDKTEDVDDFDDGDVPGASDEHPKFEVPSNVTEARKFIAESFSEDDEAVKHFDRQAGYRNRIENCGFPKALSVLATFVYQYPPGDGESALDYVRENFANSSWTSILAEVEEYFPEEETS